MQKSILIIGPHCSGKSMTLKSLLKTKQTSYVKEGFSNIKEIDAFRIEAEANNSFCIAVVCAELSFFAPVFFSNFEVIECKYDPNYNNHLK